MNVPTIPIPRARLEKFGRLLAEYRRRQAKAEQSQRGYYDDDGVRQGGLIAFVRYFWNVLEPATPLVDGWPLWAICEHLEAVTFGEITRLLINVPPGFMKSLLTDVFWPAWEWGPMGRSHYRYVAFSYSASLTERDNDRFRSLIVHPTYQSLYGPIKTRVEQGIEQKQKGVGLRNKTTLKVMNTHTGWKLASSVSGIGTGERGDRIIIDDPHNVKESESDTVREETVRWFRESISSRFNNLDSGALIVIMQRVHESDVSGTILELGFDYCHLMIPWEYDSNRQFGADGNPLTTAIGWIDPRFDENNPDANDGEPAWPERFSANAMERTKTEVGPYAWAGQFQQSPAPRGGGIFNRTWWQLWESPNGKFPVFEYLFGSLDSAFTEKEENDPSGLTIWGIFTKDGMPRIMLVHAWRKHLQFSADRALIEQLPRESKHAWHHRTMEHWGLMEWIVDSCNRFKVDRLLIEAKASGISAAQELRNRFGLQPWAVQLCPVAGDKVARALACQPTFSQQMVYAPARDWAQMVIDEMAVFPKGKYKDLTDSATQAIKHLRDKGFAQTDEEVRAQDAARVMHRPQPQALYPV